MAQVGKKSARIRRARKSRALAKRLEKIRVSVHRTIRHIYVQAIAIDGKVLASASTLDKELKTKLKNTSNISAATAVGKLFAEKCKKLKLENLMFDRSGFKYHGRVKALADAARENGLEEF